MDEVKTKKCNLCCEHKELAVHFYLSYFKSRQKHYYSPYCKKCAAIRRKKYKNNVGYVKRPTGFMKLPEETRGEIVRDFGLGLSVMQIASKYDIKYYNLYSWVKKGLVV